VGLGHDELQPAQLLGLRAEADAALAAGQRRHQVVALERLLGGAQEPGRRPRRLAAALEVLGEAQRVHLAAPDQPVGRQPVAERPVAIGQHGVGRVAHQGVTEAVVGLAGEAARRARRDDLLVGERAQPVGDLARGGRPADERADAAGPEGLAEDAGGAQHPPRPVGERLEAGLQHGQHGAGRLLAPVGELADQLLR
jgi:hypothetical protein